MTPQQYKIEAVKICDNGKYVKITFSDNELTYKHLAPKDMTTMSQFKVSADELWKLLFER